MRTARYDGIADWYESLFAHYPDEDQPGAHLAQLLGPGPARCIDLGCGTGLAAVALARHGWEVVGIDLSADQLRVAENRCVARVRGDVHTLPFASNSIDHAVSMFVHTDVDDFTAVVGEAARVLRPGGVFAYVGVHPCFVGPHIDGVSKSETELRVVPGYRDAEWVFDSPQFGEGVRKYVGVHHLPLAPFLEAFTASGFELERIEEHGAGVVPWVLGVRARRHSR
jgi:ubiquinone/menaquinone biosynthesis C-methylase UbiE